MQLIQCINVVMALKWKIVSQMEAYNRNDLLPVFREDLLLKEQICEMIGYPNKRGMKEVLG